VYAQRSVVIPRPVVEVFAFLSNPKNWPLIEAGLLEYRPLAGQPGALGAVYLSRQERRGRIVETRMQVTEFVPGQVITVEGDWAKGARPGGGFAVEPVAGGTRVTAFVKAGTRGIARLIVPLMTPIFVRSLDAILRNLERVIEGQAAHV
jgi:carbon monoxide dehydrogenase subunit G